MGEITSSTDNQGKIVITHYYPSGLPKSYEYNTYSVALEYDINGNRTSISDPDAGTINTVYNAWGELIEQSDSKENIVKFTYDKLSRITSEKQYKKDNQIETLVNTKTYTYDTEIAGSLESIEQTVRDNSINYDYDNLGRVIKSTEVFYKDDALTAPVIVDYKWEYDDLGRIKKKIYPSISEVSNISGLEVEYNYNSRGDLYSMEANGKILWKCTDVNNMGQIEGYLMGKKQSEILHDDFGKLTSINMSGRVFNYGIDAMGNLEFREDVSRGLKEKFYYDGMNRLVLAEYYNNDVHQNQYDLVMSYDTKGFGNITSKSDVGGKIGYGQFPPAGPHALTSIKELNNYSPNDQIIEYNEFNKISYIEEELENQDLISMKFVYGFDNQRRQSVSSYNGVPVKAKLFFGDYEFIGESGSEKELSYIYAPTGLCAVMEVNSGISADSTLNTTTTLWHVNPDHLGSITYMFDSNNSENSNEYSYNAWGIARNPNDWTMASATSLFADRGYTGHEHLTEFDLINMNGRVYDPVSGRFLSPDPYVQMPGAVSGFNRYSYCLNNPLIYTDPDGEFIFLVVGGAILGSYIGSALAAGDGGIKGANWNPFGGDQGKWTKESGWWKGAIVGGFIGAGAGALIAAALPASALGTPILTSSGAATTGWGLTSSSIMGANINIGMSFISEGGLDEAWRSGLVGAASGLWTASGGFGMAKAWGASNEFAKFASKLGYQAIGTSGRSIGMNWAKGEDPLSRVMVGLGPVNLTFGKDQNLFQIRNNIGNILTNSLGITNWILGGDAQFDWKNLTPLYTGGPLAKVYSRFDTAATGVYSILGKNMRIGSSLERHELHHIWQSRSMGDAFMGNYLGQLLLGFLVNGNGFGSSNWYENQAYGSYWY